MKTSLGQLLLSGTIVLAAIAFPPASPAQPAAAPGAPLYVKVTTDDPLFFDRFRYGEDTPTVNQDLIIPTLQHQAPAMARAAHWTTPIVVLSDRAEPPPGVPILRLVWSDGGRVFAEYLAAAGAKPVELGEASRNSLAYHPTPDAALNRVLSATSPGARHDERIRAETEMELYLALGMLEQHQARR